MNCPKCGRPSGFVRRRCPACKRQLVRWYVMVVLLLIVGVLLRGRIHWSRLEFMDYEARELLFVAILLAVLFAFGVVATGIFIRQYRRENRKK
jgi:uncharacterized integral membrane protein